MAWRVGKGCVAVSEVLANSAEVPGPLPGPGVGGGREKKRELRSSCAAGDESFRDMVELASCCCRGSSWWVLRWGGRWLSSAALRSSKCCHTFCRAADPLSALGTKGTLPKCQEEGVNF